MAVRDVVVEDEEVANKKEQPQSLIASFSLGHYSQVSKSHVKYVQCNNSVVVLRNKKRAGC